MVSISHLSPTVNIQLPTTGWKMFTLPDKSVLKLHPALVLRVYPLSTNRSPHDNHHNYLYFYLQSALSEDMINIALGQDFEKGLTLYVEIFNAIFDGNIKPEMPDAYEEFVRMRETIERYNFRSMTVSGDVEAAQEYKEAAIVQLHHHNQNLSVRWKKENPDAWDPYNG